MTALHFIPRQRGLFDRLPLAAFLRVLEAAWDRRRRRAAEERLRLDLNRLASEHLDDAGLARNVRRIVWLDMPRGMDPVAVEEFDYGLRVNGDGKRLASESRRW